MKVDKDNMCARVAYCVDIDKSVIIGNFEKRGWVSVGPDDDWHFYWASTTTCRNLFAVDSGSNPSPLLFDSANATNK